jgi:hypothetical protein
MEPRSGVATVGESLLVGAAVSAGVLAVVVRTPLGGVLSPVGDGILVVWLAITCLGSLSLGLWRSVPTVDLLGGGFLGMVIGWLGFSTVVGFDYVLFIVALLGMGGWICGAFLASLWRHRYKNRE